MNSIGKRIRMRRKDLELTQRELATKLNVPISTVIYWERGELSLSERDLDSIAQELTCSVAVLSGAEDIERPARGLGERLKSCRIGASLSQRQLAKLCGWINGQKRISNYEKSFRQPGYAEISIIAKVLGVSSAWLAFGNERLQENIYEHKSSLSVEDTKTPYSVHSFSEGLSRSIPVIKMEDILPWRNSNRAEGVNMQLTLPLTLFVNELSHDTQVILVSLDSKEYLPHFQPSTFLAIELTEGMYLDQQLYLVIHTQQVLICRYHAQDLGLFEALSSHFMPSSFPQDQQNIEVIGRIFWHCQPL